MEPPVFLPKRKPLNTFFVRKNVCENEGVEVVEVREPCVRAYTKYVKNRRFRCDGIAKTCVVRQPKYVGGFFVEEILVLHRL